MEDIGSGQGRYYQNAHIGGIKVVIEDSSWFAIRPSGTEPKMKLYDDLPLFVR
jgi:phosphomannomutase